MLNLNENQLTSIPESIGEMARLGSLYVEKNQLTSLPESIGKLKDLYSVQIADNQLKRDKMKKLMALLPECDWSFE